MQACRQECSRAGGVSKPVHAGRQARRSKEAGEARQEWRGTEGRAE
jgi:hypothetical protein